ncbi:hypothetical protein M441DRAFT_276332 [Trichoderma asperellum CBS 433.97]|uniref:Glucose-methanol-choline oxidoreductase C-terminal domain-containing protein n=1 Tax=Trichoderma asperellum (strain ATCC 204424 / CBS 433.97 / NBRC 101777) TaxID=1042311 RepID=A0A2T3YUX0_TRIA4|nr:hypothetical protein M441DRAFT_276332 [Trichoderma asperellum CBS 433.97]PTB36329.1 hypothetical protein M441DRAFT_276332 [Trichoderma asperellum CBS 433.97]
MGCLFLSIVRISRVVAIGRQSDVEAGGEQLKQGPARSRCWGAKHLALESTSLESKRATKDAKGWMIGLHHIVAETLCAEPAEGDLDDTIYSARGRFLVDCSHLRG